ncbi:MAG: hydantoinase B/oxoprolinase family protein [Opitutales bacterium]|nr:hydantoinase B/oxoprolinase family protein [Opitutales bacterium]
MSGDGHWRIAVDTGGTFTDCLGYAPDGSFRRAKLLSSGRLRARAKRTDGKRLSYEAGWGLPDGFLDGARVEFADGTRRVIDRHGAHTLELDDAPPPGAAEGGLFSVDTGEEAPVFGARLLTGTPVRGTLPPCDFRLGTTKGTNALLEGKSAPVCLVVTAGFEDLLAIGDQRRPDLFALQVVKERLDPARIVGATGRIDARGREIEPLEEGRLAEAFAEARGAGCSVAAVALLNAYRNDSHERRVAALLREAGFATVVESAALCPFIKYLDRAETAVVDASLGPVLQSYLDAVESGLARGSRVLVMNSAGGLLPRERFHPVDSLLSGPAGGLAGAAHCAARAGIDRVIAFDMGGTSTDVSRWAAGFLLRRSRKVGPARVVAPSLHIETVAAGGGSVCAVAGETVTVGPESAGADPGPACYGRGGPLALTDVHLLLGRLDPAAFQIPLDRSAAERAAEELSRAGGLDRDRILAGFLRIADERMAQVARTISVREGYDPREHALLVFGGAGGLHACAVAGLLGMETILMPADAGLLSALGILHAAEESRAARQVLRPLDACAGDIPDWMDTLGREAGESLGRDGAAAERTDFEAELRFTGQEHALRLPWTPGSDLAEAFRERHEAVFGYAPEGGRIEVVAISAVCRSAAPPAEEESFPDGPAAEAVRHTRLYAGGDWREVPVYERDALPPGTRLEGPCVVYDAFSTLVVEPGWSGATGSLGSLKLTAGEARRDTSAAAGATERDAVSRELFANRFRSVVEEMGDQLRRTAVSVNIRERLDFSCALLDAEGRLVVNAPHIPVHLGAMGTCARALRERLGKPEAGDLWVTNHPGFGGSHLPDITAVAPVFDREGRCFAYLATRAHHAEVGGRRPGSMPPEARSLAEEGVLIAPRRLSRAGRLDLDGVEALLRGGAYPSRNPAENLLDLQAQVAALRLGGERLRALEETVGADALHGWFKELRRLARDGMERWLETLDGRGGEAEERLDDGTPIVLRWRSAGGRLELDFTRSGGRHPGNLNATEGIVASAVLYVLRCLSGGDYPLNEGLMERVAIRAEGTFLTPVFEGEAESMPAVVGGNVETSQRLVDTLLKAFGETACSQGTMNNLLFGDGRFGYYETVGGGCGAGPGFAGASGVQVHMTNTAITDPEVIELRYPVRLRRFALRRGSGGAGRHRGGDGLVREIEYLAPVEVSLVTQHRVEAPYGRDGGDPGARGRQVRISAEGETTELDGVAAFHAAPGDRLCLETPGGGGWGPPED